MGSLISMRRFLADFLEIDNNFKQIEFDVTCLVLLLLLYSIALNFQTKSRPLPSCEAHQWPS